MKLTTRAKTGEIIKAAIDKNGDFVKLIKISKPYKNGDTFSVWENTKSPFCSCGLYTNIIDATNKFNLMVKNSEAIEVKI